MMYESEFDFPSPGFPCSDFPCSDFPCSDFRSPGFPSSGFRSRGVRGLPSFGSTDSDSPPSEEITLDEPLTTELLKFEMMLRYLSVAMNKQSSSSDAHHPFDSSYDDPFPNRSSSTLLSDRGHLLSNTTLFNKHRTTTLFDNQISNSVGPNAQIWRLIVIIQRYNLLALAFTSTSARMYDSCPQGLSDHKKMRNGSSPNGLSDHKMMRNGSSPNGLSDDIAKKSGIGPSTSTPPNKVPLDFDLPSSQDDSLDYKVLDGLNEREIIRFLFLHCKAYRTILALIEWCEWVGRTENNKSLFNLKRFDASSSPRAIGHLRYTNTCFNVLKQRSTPIILNNNNMNLISSIYWYPIIE